MDNNEQEKLFKNINETSFYFFVILAITHILSGLMYVNEIIPKGSWLINRLLDVPFLIVSLIYFFSLLKLFLMKSGNYSRLADITFAIIGGVLVIFTLFFDILFPNQLPL